MTFIRSLFIKEIQFLQGTISVTAKRKIKEAKEAIGINFLMIKLGKCQLNKF